jgi:hypothetical protein
MQTCPDTGVAIPECCCSRCVERQLDQFAPGRIQVTRAPVHHDPLLLREVRSPAPMPPVFERLNRPAL